MNEIEKNIKIAEYLNFKITKIERNTETGQIERVWAETPDSWKGKDVRPWLPNFTKDLNAMHEAFKAMNEWAQPAFTSNLLDVYRKTIRSRPGAAAVDLLHAEAEHWAEAFGITLNLWKP